MRNLPFTSRTVIGNAMKCPPPWRTEGLQHIGEAVQTVVAEVAPEMPESQQLALLILRSARNSNAKECAAVLRAKNVVANGRDYAALADAGCAKKSGQTFHVITDMGMHRSSRLMREIARDNGLHHITRGADMVQRFARCTCGWTAAAKNSGNGATSLDGHVSKHLVAVKAGTYKAPRPMEDFLAEMVG